MTTVDRINVLRSRCNLPPLPDIDWNVITGGEGQRTYPKVLRPSLHDILNTIDSAIGATTEWLHDGDCSCAWHIGKCCYRRRAVGARVRMLEEILALRDRSSRFTGNFGM
jgi:hypothetical protein